MDYQFYTKKENDITFYKKTYKTPKKVEFHDIYDVIYKLKYIATDQERRNITSIVRLVQKDICDNWKYGSSRYEMKRMLKRVSLLNAVLVNYNIFVNVEFD